MSELYPGSSQIPAMLVSKCPTDWKEKLANGDYIGTEKKDGFWYQLEKTKDGTIYLFSRSKSKKTGELSEKIDNVPHIKKWAEENIPNDSIIIGEIYYPGKTSKDVTKIMGSLPAKASQRQFNTEEFGGPIHYYIHDIIKWDGKDIMDEPYTAREQFVFSVTPSPLSDDFNYIEIAEVCFTNLEDKLKEIFDNGGEGMVFRHKDSIYKPGKRPKEIFKIKTEETFDVVIVGFVDPVMEYTGKEITSWPYWIEKTKTDNEENYRYHLWYSDDGEAYKYHLNNPHVYLPVTKAFFNRWKAGFIVGLLDGDKVIDVGSITSGMTDEMRQDAAEHPENYLGKVIEIQAMSVDSDELSIRHGRFKRMRPDKNREECTVENVFG